MRQPRTFDGRVRLDVLLADHPFPDFLGPVRERAREFERMFPDYRVDIRGYNYWTGRADFYRAVAEEPRPAIVDYFYTASQMARDARDPHGAPLYTPVERAVDGRREILGVPVVLDDIVPVARAYYSYDGELVSMPNSTSTSLLYANETLLEQAGVARIPETWDELEAACRAVARLSDGPPYAITWPNHGWFFQQAVAEQAGLLTDHMNGRVGRATTVDFRSDAMMAWVHWWERLHRDGLYLYTGVADDWPGALDAFLSQRVAFTFNSSVMADAITRAGRDAGFQVAAGRRPHNGSVARTGDVIGGDSLWLADGLDDVTRDGALAFMQYLVNAQNAAEWHRHSGFIPVTRSSYALLDREGWFRQRPHDRLATEQLEAADPSPAAQGALVGDFDLVEAELTGAMADVMQHGVDVATRFASAEEAAQKRLDAYNARCLQRG